MAAAWDRWHPAVSAMADARDRQLQGGSRLQVAAANIAADPTAYNDEFAHEVIAQLRHVDAERVTVLRRRVLRYEGRRWVEGWCSVCEPEWQQCIAYRPLRARCRQCGELLSIVVVKRRAAVGHFQSFTSLD